MRGDHAQPPSLHLEVDVDGATGLPSPDAQVDTAAVEDGQAREQGVAVGARIAHEGRSGHRRQLQLAGEVLDLIDDLAARGVATDLL